MKNTLRFIRRVFLGLILSIFLLLFLNFILFCTISYSQISGRSPWKDADTVSDALIQSEDGSYHLASEGETILKDSGAWAILLDNGSGKVKWSSENLPENIPKQYSLSELSWAVRGYIEDYPTTTSEHGDDLLILGNPKTSLWKAMWNAFDYNMIAHFPQTILLFLFFNLTIVFVISMFSFSGILRSVKPIVQGMECLPENTDIHVKEKGIFSSLACSLNQTAEKLRNQEYRLRKKETARVNWISGVSHDIRTPLSMVMGYASQLEENKALPEEERKKAGVIRLQSIRMKNLVNDLNLFSKLEYNAQPLHRRPVNAVSLLRKVVVDFLNMDADGRYPIEWNTEESLTVCMIEADENLLKRAVCNLIINAQVHNSDGCSIFTSLKNKNGICYITISDNGIGVTQEQLLSLRNAPHYMVCDSSTGEQRHGLGLLIVKQIAEAHSGTLEIDHSPEGGFSACICIPEHIA